MISRIFTVIITMLRRVNGVATGEAKIGGYCHTFMVQVLQSVLKNLATDSINKQWGTDGQLRSLKTFTIVESSTKISLSFAESSVGCRTSW